MKSVLEAMTELVSRGYPKDTAYRIAQASPEDAEALVAKNLIEAGYPEEVAQRIASGELPMDEASRMNRRREMGYDKKVYHAGAADITEFDPHAGFLDRADTGTFVTDDPIVAQSYMAPGRQTYPLYIRDREMPYLDAGGQNWSDIDADLLAPDDELIDSFSGATTNEIAREALYRNMPGVEFRGVMDMGPHIRYPFAASKERTAELSRMYIDPDVEVPTVYSVADPTLIRSQFAAFDPEYKGANILGGTAATAIGAGALMAPQDASAAIEDVDIFEEEEAPMTYRDARRARREQKADPLFSGAQTANLLAGFTGLAGVADIFGQYPEFPEDDVSVGEMVLEGQRGPSLAENIGEGNYLSAGLQTLGILPFIGVGARALSKAARSGRSVEGGITSLRQPSGLVEEDTIPVEQIKMPIAENNDELALEQLAQMTAENQPIVQSFMRNIDLNFGTKSSDNVKDPAKVVEKARRPAIIEKKPWHNISHLRDTYRFQTELEDFRDIPLMVRDLRRQGIDLVKVDTDKMFSPKEWGWRMIAFDLRMPNGQIVEWYTPLREMNKQKRDRGHYLFEQWRNKTSDELLEEQDAYYAAIRESREGYEQAFDQSLDRLGLSRPEAEAEFRKMESSLSDAL